MDVALGITKRKFRKHFRRVSHKLIGHNRREFMFDAEHFFDGYKNNPDYALSIALKIAYDEWGKMDCPFADTNGGTLTT